jgi:hypothetical protein
LKGVGDLTSERSAENSRESRENSGTNNRKSGEHFGSSYFNNRDMKTWKLELRDLNTTQDMKTADLKTSSFENLDVLSKLHLLTTNILREKLHFL